MIPDRFSPAGGAAQDLDRQDRLSAAEGSVALMDFALTDEQRILRERDRAFRAGELNAGVIERDRDQAFPRELWRQVRRDGPAGLPVPEEYGGAALDPLSTAIALEALGYGCEDGGPRLLRLRPPAVVRRADLEVRQRGAEAAISPRLCNGALIAANAMTRARIRAPMRSPCKHEAGRDGDGFGSTARRRSSRTGPMADVASSSSP